MQSESQRVDTYGPPDDDKTCAAGCRCPQASSVGIPRRVTPRRRVFAQAQLFYLLRQIAAFVIVKFEDQLSIC